VVVKSIQNFLITAAITFFIGFTLSSSSPASNPLLGWGDWVLLWGSDTPSTSYPRFVCTLLFVLSGSQIVGRALSERARLEAYLLISCLMALLLMPIPLHWVNAENGLLRKEGFIDMGGASTVHVIGGLIGLFGSVILKPRTGRFSGVKYLPHNLTMASTGLLIVWHVHINVYSSVVSCMSPVPGVCPTFSGLGAINTALAPVFSGLVVMLAKYIRWKKVSLLHTLNGVHVGIVCVSAGPYLLPLWTAPLAGVVAGGVLLLFSSLLQRQEIDDPLETFSVHVGGGLTSLMFVALFADPDLADSLLHAPAGGLFIVGDASLLLVQLWGVVLIVGYVTLFSLPLCLLLNRRGLLRVSEDAESAGLDISLHGTSSYPDFVLIS